MANHQKLIPFILQWEGGWSDLPNDRGGKTMRGVTFSTYKEFCRKKNRPAPSVDDLRNISNEDWGEIFKEMFWDRWRADEINSQSVANLLVDWLWCSGYSSVKTVQKVLKVDVDGVVGPKTLLAINQAMPEKLFVDLKKARKQFLLRIVENDPLQNCFLNGWMNRLNNLKFEA